MYSVSDPWVGLGERLPRLERPCVQCEHVGFAEECVTVERGVFCLREASPAGGFPVSAVADRLVTHENQSECAPSLYTLTRLSAQTPDQSAEEADF